MVKRFYFSSIAALSIFGIFAQAHAEYTSEQAVASIKRFESFYSNRTSDQGQPKRLSIQIDLNDQIVSAHPSCNSKEKLDCKIIVSGAFVKLPYLTEDIMSLMLCHELGHIDGGHPYKTDQPLYSAEGQADYFAPDCLKHYWANEDNSIRPSTESDPIPPQEVVDSCMGTYSSENESGLCVRVTRAAFGLANEIFKQNERDYAVMFASSSLPTSISFLTPSKEVRRYEIKEDWPDAQCRLDTFYASILGKPRPSCWYVQK